MGMEVFPGYLFFHILSIHPGYYISGWYQIHPEWAFPLTDPSSLDMLFHFSNIIKFNLNASGLIMLWK